MYKYDLFISYAHKDDKPPAGLKVGWVTTFVEHLKLGFQGKSGPQVKVWTDSELASNDQVTPTLMDTVQASRTLVLFLSPSYQNSVWCQKELGAFLENHAATKNKESVFIVEVEPVDRERWHPRLRELTQLKLYRQERENAPAVRFGYPSPKMEEGTPYWDRINELAHLIVKHLKFLDPRRFESPTPTQPSQILRSDQPPARAERPLIWLAEPTEDLFDEWEHLAGALRQADCEVRPSGPDAYDRGSETVYQDAVRGDLEAAQLLVQLLGKREGRRSAKGTQSCTVLQSSLAREFEGKLGRHFLQWRSFQADLETPDKGPYRQLLTGAMVCGFEEFRQHVLTAVAALRRPPERARQPESAKEILGIAESLAICVSAHKQDESLGREVAEMLLDLGEDAVMPSAEPAVDELPEQFNEQLKSVIGGSEGVIIVYGRSSPGWVQAQYINAKKLLAQKRRGVWGALLDGPPEGKPQPVFSSNLLLLDCRGGVTREQIARFVQTLRGPAHAGAPRARQTLSGLTAVRILGRGNLFRPGVAHRPPARDPPARTLSRRDRAFGLGQIQSRARRPAPGAAARLHRHRDGLAHRFAASGQPPAAESRPECSSRRCHRA